MKRLVVTVALLLSIPVALADPPSTFPQAKVIAKEKVYFDQASGRSGELYCGCDWRWTGKSGGRIDFASCGYQTRKQQNRAERIEWEHIVPAQTFGQQRQCWQKGGRRNCIADDPVFRVMEANLFNLYPSVGEVNGDRSNFNYGVVAGASEYGQCRTKVDFKARAAEPRDEVKGLVARVTFYMFDRYGLNMSRQQQQLLMAWDKQFPVSSWERQRDDRIAAIMGHHNPFVTGERKWTLGYKPVGDGVVSQLPSRAQRDQQPKAPIATSAGAGNILGNRNSHIYHLPSGCPSYNDVAPKNRVMFKTEREATAAGYRKAKNCSR